LDFKKGKIFYSLFFFLVFLIVQFKREKREEKETKKGICRIVAGFFRNSKS